MLGDVVVKDFLLVVEQNLCFWLDVKTSHAYVDVVLKFGD